MFTFIRNRSRHPARFIRPHYYLSLPAYLLKWLVVGGLVGILSGSASALFLTALDHATDMRERLPWLLWLLPLAGVAISFMYARFGGNSGRGNNLILEQINGGQETIPLRMAPFVLVGTLATHLFGGSAGREGTAVQMGGSLAEWVGRLFRLSQADRRIILMCGISSGFGSVFGTPLAGTVFGLEVLAIGLLSHEALIPCFIASFTGDRIVALWGVKHLRYPIGAIPDMSAMLIVKVAAASVLFGLAAILFSELTHALKKLFASRIPSPALRSFAGGLALIALTFGVGTRDYNGLGIPLIVRAFDHSVSPLAFLLKTLFTSLTLGAGFQGGEVTPLFVIGATLGSALSGLLHVAAPFLAALGFIAVFCGATNTPLACFIMGIELFGADAAVYLFLACIISYAVSGHTGIYTSQRIGAGKPSSAAPPEDATLGSIRGK